MTKSIRWIRTEINITLIFDGLSDVKDFLHKYEWEIPSKQRIEALALALRATLARWWQAHKANITTWEDCKRLIIIIFHDEMEAIQCRYGGQSDQWLHIEACIQAWWVARARGGEIYLV